MCTAILPPGGNPIAVNNYIIKYHTKPTHKGKGNESGLKITERFNYYHFFGKCVSGIIDFKLSPCSEFCTLSSG
jgi:hypothetical protein